jgi:hypothetical protein
MYSSTYYFLQVKRNVGHNLVWWSNEHVDINHLLWLFGNYDIACIWKVRPKLPLTDPKLLGKHKLELSYIGDGRVFLNFWDWAHGNDVCVQIIDGHLVDGNEQVISIKEFISTVEASICKREL